MYHESQIVAKSKALGGVIRADEAYSKQELLSRLQISQKFWDRLLDAGLPYAEIGHARWVRGQAVLDYIEKNAQTKNPSTRDTVRTE